jgi:uncharacterized protein
MPSRSFIESRDAMERMLAEATLGYLGLSLEGAPYVVPVNYGYQAGRILFHCALTGKKLDYLRANPQVCFTVGRQAGTPTRHAKEGPCHPDYESVICYGTARIVEDLEERRNVLTTFNRCLEPGAGVISLEDAAKCGAVEIKVTEMTGRQEQNSKCTYWKFTFEA